MFKVIVPCSHPTCNNTLTRPLWVYLLDIIFSRELYPYYCYDCTEEFDLLTDEDWEEIRLLCVGY